MFNCRFLTVASDRIDGTLNSSGDAWAVAADLLKACDRMWHSDFLQKLNSYWTHGQNFKLFSAIFHRYTALGVSG